MQLRAACDRAGGITALACLIGKPRVYLQRRMFTVGKKMTQPYPVSRMDELAILSALKLKSVDKLAAKQPPKEGTMI